MNNVEFLVDLLMMAILNPHTVYQSMIYTVLILGSLLIPYEGDLSKFVYLSTIFPLGVFVFCLVLLKHLEQLMMLLVMLAVVFFPD